MKRLQNPFGILILLLATGFLLSGIPLLGQAPAGYYDTVDSSSAAALRATLHEVIDDHIWFPYTDANTDTWDIINTADEDPSRLGNIVDVYKNASYAKISGGTGAYNREHTWPKSYGFPNLTDFNYPHTDVHHLFAADVAYNAERSNKPFRFCDAACAEWTTDSTNGRGGGTGVYPGNSNWTSGDFTQGTWETWDGRKGDVARALFYMDIRYEGGFHGVTGHLEPDLRLTDNETLIDQSRTGSNESVAYMGMLSVLLAWHAQDPPDDVERARNDAVYSFQANRNPFIDHPEWVECLFGTTCGVTPPPPGNGDGVLLSEVLYDVSGNDNGYEWVELYNPTASAVDVTGWCLANGGTDWSFSQVTLSGSIAAGATFVVGGPVSGAANANPSFDQAVDFSPDFQNSGNAGDGVALFDVPCSQVLASVPVDAVIYGPNNNNGLIDETGSANAPEVGDAGAGSSLERVDLAGTWQIRSAPTPNSTPVPPPPAGSDVILSEVLYDVSGNDNGYEWVEIYNPGENAVDVTGWCVAGGGLDWATTQVTLSGVIAPGATFVVGGPSSSSVNANPVLDQAANFNPDLQNSGSAGDGVALFNVACSQALSSVPVDAVIYGPNNNNGLIDETGNVNPADVGDASSGSSIERVDLAGSWQIQPSPTPNATPF